MSIDLGTLRVIGHLNAYAKLSKFPNGFIPLSRLSVNTQAQVVSDYIVYDDSKGKELAIGDWAFPVVTAVSHGEDGKVVVAEYLTEKLDDLAEAYVVVPGQSHNSRNYMLLTFQQVVDSDSRIVVQEDVIVSNGTWYARH